MEQPFLHIESDLPKPGRSEVALGSIVVFDVSPPNISAIVAKPTRNGWEFLESATIQATWDDEEGLPEEVLRTLLSKLDDSQETRRAALVLPSEGAVHELVSLPKMGTKDRTRIFERKVDERTSNHGDQYAFEAIQMGQAKESSVRSAKDAYLLTAAPRRTLFSLHDRVRKLGLEPTWFSATPASHFAIVQAIQPTETTAWALVDLDGRMATLTIQSGNTIVLLRTIRFRSSSDHPGMATDLCGEMQRSLLYYQQRFPGESVERIVIASHKPDLGSQVADALKGNLDPQIFLLNPLEISGCSDPSRSAHFHDTPNLTRTLGLLIAIQSKSPGYNLNPPEIRSRKVQMRATVFVALFLLLVGVGAHFFTAETPGMAEDSRRLQKETITRLSNLEDVLDSHDQMIEQKLRTQVLQEAYDQLSNNRVNWITFFNQLSTLPREKLHANRVTLYRQEEQDSSNGDSDSDRWYAGIGCSADGTFVETQALMRQAASVLRSASMLDRVNVKPPSGRTESSGEAEDPMTPFEIECRLKNPGNTAP